MKKGFSHKNWVVLYVYNITAYKQRLIHYTFVLQFLWWRFINASNTQSKFFSDFVKFSYELLQRGHIKFPHPSCDQSILEVHRNNIYQYKNLFKNLRWELFLKFFYSDLHLFIIQILKLRKAQLLQEILLLANSINLSKNWRQGITSSPKKVKVLLDSLNARQFTCKNVALKCN